MSECQWCHNSIDPLSSGPLCNVHEAMVLERARQLVVTDKPITYPEFANLVPEEVKARGGFWHYHVQATLELRHGWQRHKNRERKYWGNCGFPAGQKPQTHFHPPTRL